MDLFKKICKIIIVIYLLASASIFTWFYVDVKRELKERRCLHMKLSCLEKGYSEKICNLEEKICAETLPGKDD